MLIELHITKSPTHMGRFRHYSDQQPERSAKLEKNSTIFLA